MSGEKQKGIWKKGIEKHCFPRCWKKKTKALKEASTKRRREKVRPC